MGAGPCGLRGGGGPPLDGARRRPPLPPGRPAARPPAASSPELTEHELRLAGLVCAGATNQEAAQQMFVSAKTVESTLSRLYRKLGIRNRTQLTATLGP
ncbi:helix-turn-helix transcriptional regulator [Streptomyces xanthophaeus]|uniref:response regulator transcription factor n=1 Tax=Streptomyces xanthophaeus TaxID=67385 RepID=UPI003412FCA2